MANVTPGVVFPQNATWSVPAGTVTAPNTPYSGTFIPTLWSGKLAKKFYATTIFGEIANTDYQGEISGIGDKVIINTIPDTTIRDYQVGGPLNYEAPEGETITLTIDSGKYFALTVNDVLEHQSKPNLMNMFTDDASIKMKQVIDKDVIYKTFFDENGAFRTSESGKSDTWVKNLGPTAGAVSGAYNMGTDAVPVALTAANILAQITAMSTILDEANVPEEGRYLVITPFERHILMQSNLAQAQFMGDPKSIIRNGKIGTIDRFTIYVNNQLPRVEAGLAWDGKTEAADSVKRHLIFAGHKCAITFASQITKVENLRNPNDFGDLVRGLNVYGTKVIQGQGLVPMVVAG